MATTSRERRAASDTGVIGEPRAGDAGTLPRRRRRLPLALWACAAIACANAAIWAVITPSFWTPDESAHVGYVQWMAETGRVPRGLDPDFVPSEEVTVAFQGVQWSLEGRPSWWEVRDARIRRQLSGKLGRERETGAAYTAGNPPLYYAFAAIPYRLGSGGDLYDRLLLMRLLSALLAGVTVAFVFLFLRELLPSTPWAWTVGALAVAFQPVFGFIGGAVNNDSLLFAASACLMFLVARAFRRGLNMRLALGVIVAAGVGVITKTSMFGLLPGAALALALIAWRSPAGQRSAARRAAAVAVALTAVVVGAWLVANNVVFERPGETTTGGLAQKSVSDLTSFRGEASYLWQFFLPRLPFMTEMFPGYPSYPFWQTYIQGFIGRFGWFQLSFPAAVYWVGLGALAIVLAMAAAALTRSRDVLRARWPELLTYIVFVIGMLVLVGTAGYRYRAATETTFEQTRYLFPLLPLYGALIALAARGAGPRWGRAAGCFLVVLAMGHSFFSMLYTVGRYYG